MPFATLTGNSSRIRFAHCGRVDRLSRIDLLASTASTVPVGTRLRRVRQAEVQVCLGVPQLRCDRHQRHTEQTESGNREESSSGGPVGTE